MEPAKRVALNPGGFCVAATYILIVAGVFALTAATTKPSNVGLDWLPFILLAAPWYWISANLLLPGLAVNAGVMYVLGVLLHKLWSRLTKQ